MTRRAQNDLNIGIETTSGDRTLHIRAFIAGNNQNRSAVFDACFSQDIFSAAVPYDWRHR